MDEKQNKESEKVEIKDEKKTQTKRRKKKEI